MTTTKAKKQTWVAHHQGDWQVKKDNGKKAIKRFETQKEAIKFGRQVAKNEGGELVVQGQGGRIREKSTVKTTKSLTN